MRIPLAPALLALLPLAQPALAKPREVPAATPVGKAVTCINPSRIRETQVRSDSIIDFYMRTGETYRVTLPYACPSLGSEQRFTYSTRVDQLCSMDTISVLYTGAPNMRGPTCGLDKFQPVKIAKATKR